MAPYFDYSPPPGIDLTPGMSALGDALTEMIRAKQNRQKEERLAAQRKMEIDYQNRSQDRLEKKDQAQFISQDEGRRANAEKAIQEHLARGDIEGAKLIASGTSTFDPKTYERTGSLGIRVAEPQLPPRPEAPVRPEIKSGVPPEVRARLKALNGTTEPFVGPIASMGEQARSNAWDLQDRLDVMREREQRTWDDAENQVAMEDYETQRKAYPGQVRQYEQDTERARREAPVFLTSPGQPDRQVDVQALRLRDRRTNADEFLASVGPLVHTDADRAALEAAHAGILAGGLDPKSAMVQFQRERLGLHSEDFKREQGATQHGYKMEEIKAKPISPFQAMTLEVSRGGLALRAEEAGNREFLQFVDRQGYKADVATMKDLMDTNQALKQGNSALDVTAGAQFAKKAQGAGVLTDRDYDRFWSAIGGMQARPADWFERVISGRMGEQKRRIVIDAIRHKVDAEEHRLRTVATQADKKFGGEPWYPGTRAAYFGFLPELPETAPAVGPRIGTSGIPKGPPEVRAKLKAKAKGSKLEDLLKAAEALP